VRAFVILTILQQVDNLLIEGIIPHSRCVSSAGGIVAPKSMAGRPEGLSRKTYDHPMATSLPTLTKEGSQVLSHLPCEPGVL